MLDGKSILSLIGAASVNIGLVAERVIDGAVL